jgi:hypothetical protein
MYIHIYAYTYIHIYIYEYIKGGWLMALWTGTWTGEWPGITTGLIALHVVCTNI